MTKALEPIERMLMSPNLPYLMGTLLLLFFLFLAFFLLMVRLRNQRRNKEREELERRVRAQNEEHHRKIKLLGMQETKGGELCNALKRAARNNLRANQLPDGRVPEGVSGIHVGKYPGGGGYTMVVFMENPRSTSGQDDILEASVSLLGKDPGKALRYYIPGQEEKYFPVEEFEEFKRTLEQFVLNFRRYGS